MKAFHRILNFLGRKAKIAALALPVDLGTVPRSHRLIYAGECRMNWRDTKKWREWLLWQTRNVHRVGFGEIVERVETQDSDPRLAREDGPMPETPWKVRWWADDRESSFERAWGDWACYANGGAG